MFASCRDPAGAQDQFAALLPIYEGILGHEHPSAVAVRGDLARWTREAEDNSRRK